MRTTLFKLALAVFGAAFPARLLVAIAFMTLTLMPDRSSEA
jgi:hypothetical protein